MTFQHPASALSPEMEFHNDLQTVILEIRNMLLDKNRKYGDSALNPARLFSKQNAIEQIKVRLDDKLSRIKNQQEDEDEDPELDLIGYLSILRIAKLRLRNPTSKPQT